MDSAALSETRASISVTELRSVCGKMQPLVSALQRDYRTLKLYGVLTHSGADALLFDGIRTMLAHAPEAFFDTPGKTIARRILKIKDPELPADVITQLKLHLEQLQLKPDCLLEVRFHHLDYPEILRLQHDPRIDPTRTPKSKASIRIVLGMLHELVGDSSEP